MAKQPHVANETVVATSVAEIERLKKELAETLAKLEAATVAATASDKRASDAAKALADAQGFMVLQREITEIPTGETVKVKRCKNYEVISYRDDGRPVHKPIFEEVELPTYWYRIDLPPSGGQGVQLNIGPGGIWYYQDETYKLDIDTLRTVKDIVHRSWAHEATIKGNDENVFRKPANRVLSGRARQ